MDESIKMTTHVSVINKKLHCLPLHFDTDISSHVLGIKVHNVRSIHLLDMLSLSFPPASVSFANYFCVEVHCSQSHGHTFYPDMTMGDWNNIGIRRIGSFWRQSNLGKRFGQEYHLFLAEDNQNIMWSL